MGGILDDFGSKYNQRAWGTVLPAIIGGAGAGGLARGMQTKHVVVTSWEGCLLVVWPLD